MANIQKFLVGLMLLCLITAIFAALDMLDLVLSFVLLAVVFMVAAELIREPTYEWIRGAFGAFIKGMKASAREAIYEDVAS